MSGNWIEAASRDAIPEDDVIGLIVGGRDIALYGVDGEVFATDNACTHGNARLCDGFLEGHEIECPLHQGKFDVRTGAAMCAPLTEAVRTYPIRIEAGKVYVDLGCRRSHFRRCYPNGLPDGR
ncbi:non-heme iron oxygenase ferredoxin subunit [Pandoraea apista]|nr:non-heme iron oxygenase ferredoxin subunit [Pandoraea apista]RSD06291.1 non-heme iron oxygenase ferredoxin subunit [Pandoraea apista]